MNEYKFYLVLIEYQFEKLVYTTQKDLEAMRLSCQAAGFIVTWIEQ